MFTHAAAACAGRRRTPCRPQEALLLSAVLLVALVLGARQAEAFPICIKTAPGFGDCDPAKDPSTYSGMTVELTRFIADALGWKESSNATNAPFESGQFTFKCTSYSYGGMVSFIADPNNAAECPMGVGPFTITTTRMDMGITFSYPFQRTGLGILVKAASVEYDAWAFVKPFSWDIWLALGVTALLVPLLVWLVEKLFTRGFVPITRHSLEEIRTYEYRTMLSIFNLTVPKVVSWPAQINILMFNFLILILVSTYTANLAAFLTITSIGSNVHSVSDLRGKAVAAHGIYGERLKLNYGLRPERIDFNDVNDFHKIAAQLRSGDLVAYLYDKPELEFYQGKYDTGCTLRFLDGEIEPFDLAFLFSPAVNSTIIEAFNRGMVIAQSQNMLETLLARFISSSESGTCKRTATAATSVSFSQVSGLWYIACGVFGFTLLVAVISMCRKLLAAYRDGTSLALDASGASMASRRPSIARAMSSVFKKEVRDEDEDERYTKDTSTAGGGASVRISSAVRVMPADGSTRAMSAASTHDDSARYVHPRAGSSKVVPYVGDDVQAV